LSSVLSPHVVAEKMGEPLTKRNHLIASVLLHHCIFSLKKNIQMY